MHDPARYRELLQEFRAMHKEVAGADFSFRLCHWSSPPTVRPDTPSEVYLKDAVKRVESFPGEVEVVGMLSFPDVNPKWMWYEILANPQFEESAARHCGDEIMQGWWRPGIVYAMTRHIAHQRMVKHFVALAEKAGRELPLAIRETIPKQATVVVGEPSSYVDRWLALMFWNAPPALEELLTLNQWGKGRHIFWEPFSNAADVIERCRLTTESPTFITEGNVWPRWAGQIPQSLLQVHDEPPAKRGAKPRTSRCELDDFVLLALGELKAFDKDNRRTAEQVANHLDPKNDRYYVKKPLAKLKQLKLVDSHQGPKGGSWLTAKGKQQFNRATEK